jgi:uncharacterized protein (TIGR00255 family)
MIRSMTAYARREIKGSWGSATWEMRSVNQRYLETISVCRSSSAALSLLYASVSVRV